MQSKEFKVPFCVVILISFLVKLLCLTTVDLVKQRSELNELDREDRRGLKSSVTPEKR